FFFARPAHKSHWFLQGTGKTRAGCHESEDLPAMRGESLLVSKPCPLGCANQRSETPLYPYWLVPIFCSGSWFRAAHFGTGGMHEVPIKRRGGRCSDFGQRDRRLRHRICFAGHLLQRGKRDDNRSDL